jgi:DNA polymerase-3 subunit epsilon
MRISRDLVVIDIETTGTWIEKDKIIEIAMIKCHADGSREKYDKRINPGIMIPETVVKLTGIRNEDVKECPLFKDVASEIFGFLNNCDLAGFNLERFDLPLLEREFEEVGYAFSWKNRQVYDAQKVFHLNEKRDLTAAFLFYCHKDLLNAHSAMADTEATLEIIEAQVNRYGNGEDKIETLQAFDYVQYNDFYDNDKRFRWWNGNLYMMFGKYAKKHTLQDIVQKDKKYLEWILSADFSPEIKDLVANALNGKFPQPPEKGQLESLF